MRGFPNLETVAVTLRASFDADTSVWSAVLRNATGFFPRSIQGLCDR